MIRKLCMAFFLEAKFFVLRRDFYWPRKTKSRTLYGARFGYKRIKGALFERNGGNHFLCYIAVGCWVVDFLCRVANIH